MTTKAEAFAAPFGLYHSSSFSTGSNALTKEEQLLIEAHEANDRSDLAQCVSNGRIYQRLKDAMRYDSPEGIRLSTVNALREAFLGERAGKGFDSLWDWGNVVLERYGGDEKVQHLLERESRLSD